MMTRIRLGVALLLALAVAALSPLANGGPKQAAAHPLGNFTVNRYARIELSPNTIHVRYVLDMAEIPAFTETQQIVKDAGVVSDAARADYASRKAVDLAKGLALKVDGKEVRLQPTASDVTFPPGQGGLSTLRLVVDYDGAMPAGWQSGMQASFRDSNYSDRVGWKEIVVQPQSGVGLVRSTAPSTDVSSELTAYPQERLKSPLDVREATFAFAPGDGSVTSAASTAPAPAKGKQDQTKALGSFARLVERQDLTPAFVALALLAAVAWGAAHALGPGHGKTIVAAYLVGSQGTPRHALLLGLTVTLTHTSTVVLLGLVTLYASRFVGALDLYLWLSVGSGLLVVAMGLVLLVARTRGALGIARRSIVAHSHDVGSRQHHADEHVHDHDHSHAPAGPGLRGLIALGVSGGLLPCPTALVVMLGAIALHRIGFGLVLIFAFSLGLAGVLTGIGLLLVYGKGLFAGSGRIRSLAGLLPVSGRALQLLPIGSALAILAVGVALTSQALGGL